MIIEPSEAVVDLDGLKPVPEMILHIILRQIRKKNILLFSFMSEISYGS